MYNEGSRRYQDRYDTRRLADRLEERFLSRPTIDESDRTFIEGCDMFFIATADADGRPQCSYKGGEPGFVRVLDERTIAFPNYDGNGMYLSMGNTLENAPVGMLFIDFENQKRMRLNGLAQLEDATSLGAPFPEAEFIVKVSVREVFPNCPRYIHKMQLVERSRFVPREKIRTPVPGWKRMDWARDVMSASDRARSPEPE